MGDRFKSGNVTAQFDTDLDQMFTGLLNTVAPNATRIMQQTIAQIQTDALPLWPKRKPQVRLDAEGKVIFYKDTSKKSYQMFVRGTRLDPDGNIVVYLKNTAPYAYMIRYGVDPENAQRQDIIKPQGRNVADETLTKPMKANANKVVRALADDLTRVL